jgi:hypothetical protein
VLGLEDSGTAMRISIAVSIEEGVVFAKHSMEEKSGAVAAKLLANSALDWVASRVSMFM